VRAAVGGGLEAAIERIAGPEHVAKAVPIYRAYWETILLDDVTLLPGARELLTALRAQGVKVAVFTNKLGTSSRLIAEHLGIAALLDGNFGAKDTPWIKPAPEFTAHVLAQLGANPATTLLVGDSPFDVQTAKNGGFPCWVVTTGTHNAAELTAAGADRVFADLTTLAVALD
jgi:phosphoglycolate phosphatase